MQPGRNGGKEGDNNRVIKVHRHHHPVARATGVVIRRAVSRPVDTPLVGIRGVINKTRISACRTQGYFEESRGIPILCFVSEDGSGACPGGIPDAQNACCIFLLILRITGFTKGRVEVCTDGVIIIGGFIFTGHGIAHGKAGAVLNSQPCMQ